MKYSYAVAIENVNIVRPDEELPRWVDYMGVLRTERTELEIDLKGVGDNGFRGSIVVDPYKQDGQHLFKFLAEADTIARSTKYGLYYPLIITIETPELPKGR